MQSISSRSYGQCNQAGPSYSGQVESAFLECSKDRSATNGKWRKNSTTPENGPELNVNALEGWMRRLFLHCPSFPRLGARESSASLRF